MCDFAPESMIEDDEFEVPLDEDLISAAMDFVNNLPYVTCFDASLCRWLKEGVVQTIGNTMSCLEWLNITGCASLWGRHALDPLRALQGCRSLYMSGLNVDVGADFLAHLANLRILECRDNQAVNDDDICGLLTVANELEHLSLEGCKNITNRVPACALNILRGGDDMRILKLFLGETSARGAYAYVFDENLKTCYARFTVRLYGRGGDPDM